jgi:hypothetical protein
MRNSNVMSESIRPDILTPDILRGGEAVAVGVAIVKVDRQKPSPIL